MDIYVSSGEHLKADYVTTPREGFLSLKAPSNASFFSLFLEDAPLRYPKILCTPEKKEQMRENGDIAWRRSSRLTTADELTRSL